MIRTVVIGAGQIAQQHLACISGLHGVELAGVCDLSSVLAEYAADRYGARAYFTDHLRMLAEVRPDVVHIATPPTTHFRLAQDCLKGGAHVFVEKPATPRLEEFVALQTLAEAQGKLLIEDYNYLFNEPVRRLRDWMDNGELGEVIHVEVIISLNVLDKDNPFMDPNLRHAALDMPGGVITDFLPHLASLAYFFCGAPQASNALWLKRTADSPLSYDEFRALVQGERATAALVFSAHAQPDLFRLTVFGSRARASADIFENRLTRASLRTGPRPLIPFYNALDEAKATRRSAWKLLWKKLDLGPGTYEGLWILIRRVYDSIASGAALPYSPADMREVNKLVEQLKKCEHKN